MPRTIENPGSGKGSQPASLAAIKPHQYKCGDQWTGNRGGGHRAGASFQEWLNAFDAKNADGSCKYTMDEVTSVAEAAGDDRTVSPMKRAAAQAYVEIWRGGRTAREYQALMLDRLLGKAPQSVNITGGPEIKRVILMDGERILPALPEADGE